MMAMSNSNLGLPPASEQVGILVTRLAEAESALHAATHGQVDAVINPQGHTILLRETQQALQATNERLRHLVAHSPVLIYSLKVEGDVVSPLLVSENVMRVVGY